MSRLNFTRQTYGLDNNESVDTVQQTAMTFCIFHAYFIMSQHCQSLSLKGLDIVILPDTSLFACRCLCVVMSYLIFMHC